MLGIIFISHKINEVMEVCNRYLVLRDGNLVAEGNVSEVMINDFTRFMVGFDVRTEPLREKDTMKTWEKYYELRGLQIEHNFRDIHFSIKAGEIVGVTGLLGDGRSELFQAIFGADKVSSRENLFKWKRT